MIITMTDVEILDSKTEDRNNRDNNVLNPGLEHELIISQASPDNNKILSQFTLPRVFSASVPRRNKSLFRYRMNRSLDFGIISPSKAVCFKSPNSNLDYPCDANKLRNLSRSAKIMRALSSNTDFLRHQNVSIKKTLNFDSTPSPKKKSFDGNSSIDSINTDTSSPDKVLSLDSSTSNISVGSVTASSQSMDENQNQTPQQNRKITRILSDEILNIKENTDESRSSSSPSTSLLRNNLKARIDDIVSVAQTSDLQFSKQNDRSKVCGFIIAASTPRNLFQEFYDTYDECNSSPDNIMHLSPEDMNIIKKNHEKKKEMQHKEEQSITQQMDISITNKDLHTRTRELSEINMLSNTNSTLFIKKSQKKNKNINKMLVYDSDDELPDARLVIDYDTQLKITPRRANLSEDGLDKIEYDNLQNIDTHDYEENVQDSMYFTNQDGNNCNVDAMSENRAISPEPNSTTPNFNGVTTPENHINILQQISTESIKKSHKKVKHENGKALSKTRIPHHITEPVKSEMSIQDTCKDDQCEDIKNKMENTTCVTNLQNSDRANTPENINSSRLLLSQFNSVKKSHKKDKNSKRISGLAKCHKYHEYRKRVNNSLPDYGYEKKTNDEEVLCKNKSFDLKEFIDISPNKKKKSMDDTSNDVPEFSFSPISPSLKCKMDEEFKIYTPMRKRISSTPLRICEDKIQERNELAQSVSREIDCSRCLTPIVHRFGQSREDEDLTSEGYTKTKRLNLDSCISNERSTNNIILIDESGRSTPINMSTTELFGNINSIKRSHKKDKHSGSICKRSILKKKQSNTEETRTINFAISKKKEHTTLSLTFLNVDDDYVETGTCSNTLSKEERDEVFYDNPQPSTSRATDVIEDAKDVKKSRCLNTPPNSLNAMNYIKLLHTTSIKRSHKKERDCKAQAKYILMSEDYDLSDDGSIYNEEHRLNSETHDKKSD